MPEKKNDNLTGANMNIETSIGVWVQENLFSLLPLILGLAAVYRRISVTTAEILMRVQSLEGLSKTVQRNCERLGAAEHHVIELKLDVDRLFVIADKLSDKLQKVDNDLARVCERIKKS